MEKIHKKLMAALGFSDKKAMVFTALLQLGECTASDIAKKARLKRTTVYNILPELLEEGYIKSSRSKDIKKFFIDSPDIILEKARERADTVEKILPDIRSIFSIVNNKPKITVLEGFAGIKEIYEDFIKSTPKGGTVVCYAGSTRDIFNYLPEEFLYSYMDKRLSKNISMKIIAGHSKLTERMTSDAKAELRQIRTSKAAGFNFTGEAIIYGDKVAFISYKENFLCTLIESKEIAMMQRAVFELAWQSAD